MDDDQQFCLRWNNHQSTLISVFDTLLENQTLVDCTLAAEGKFLKAHKVVLSACSPYFATLLQEQYDKHPIFILKDVKFQELRAMMDYMYRGEVNISQDQLAALLKAAESLQIKGLSDNRSTGNINPAPKLDGAHQQHRNLNVGANVGIKIGGGYTLEQTKRTRLGPNALDVQEMSGSREGSSSPSRRRKKVRRRSIEASLADIQHDNSNSSLQQQSNVVISAPGISNVNPISAAASVLAAAQLPSGATPGTVVGTSQTVASSSSSAAAAAAAAVAAANIAPGLVAAATQQMLTNVTKKTESVKGASASSEAMNTEDLATGVSVDEQEQQQTASKVDKHNHKYKATSGKDTSDIVEPKSEYDDDGNEGTVEDLTLDEEDMGIDDLDQNAGTSHVGEGSSQGYAPWQHERSQDDLLMTQQDAQQRDPQVAGVGVAAGSTNSSTGSSNANSSQTPPPQSPLVRDYWYELKFSDLFKFINPDGRYQCPRFNCLKSYKDASSLQRHIRYECGGQKKFRCLMCGKAFSQSSHLKRHLESGVCVKYYLSKLDKSEQTDISPEEYELDDCLLESNDIVITQNKDGFVLHVKKLGGSITTAKLGSNDEEEVATTAVTAVRSSSECLSQSSQHSIIASLNTGQSIKLPSTECELINLKKMVPVTTNIQPQQQHQQTQQQHQQQQQPQAHTQQPHQIHQIHQMPQEIHQEPQHETSLVDNMVATTTTTGVAAAAAAAALPTQTINLLGLRNVQITEQPKPSNQILSRIKYSRGKLITTQAAATTANMQIIETHDNSSTQSVGPTELSECGKYEISEIDLNNTATSATIISDLVKYAEIDDIELPDGTKIGIGFAPSDITEHQLQQTSNNNTPQIKVETSNVHHQLQLQNTIHNVQQQMRQLQDHDEATTSVEECILPDGIELQEQPLTKSYTILTTRPVKQELSGCSNSSLMASVEGLEVSNVSAECGESNTTTYELSLSDSSMHPDDTKYVCRHCGKKYRWKSTLRRHENVECGGKEPCHPCPHCSYKAKQRGNLGVHVRKHHPDKPQLASKRGRK